MTLLFVGQAYAESPSERITQAEAQIRTYWKTQPKTSYKTLEYKGTLEEIKLRTREVRTVQGHWIPLQDLPADTQVFLGDDFPDRQRRRIKGGAGYFFCRASDGKLVAYLLMK